MTQTFHPEIEALFDDTETCVPVVEASNGPVAMVSAKNFERMLVLASRDRDTVKATQIERAGKPPVYLMPEPVFDELYSHLEAANRLFHVPVAGHA